MPRGGYRPGSGGRVTLPETEADLAPDIRRAAVNADMSPLEYMLTVMRDPKVPEVRRDRMAQAAAPFVHARMADDRIGKKATRAEKAKAANTQWLADLAERGGKPRQ
jgi:hypothetical protein